MRAESVAAAAQ